MMMEVSKSQDSRIGKILQIWFLRRVALDCVKIFLYDSGLESPWDCWCDNSL